MGLDGVPPTPAVSSGSYAPHPRGRVVLVFHSSLLPLKGFYSTSFSHTLGLEVERFMPLHFRQKVPSGTEGPPPAPMRLVQVRMAASLPSCVD